jgi:hypothetical protein
VSAALTADPSDKWPRPTALQLDLGVSVGSRVDTEASEFGWEVWRGEITAVWDLDETTAEALAALSAATGWGGKAPGLDEGGLTMRVGELERWLLRLNGEDVGNPSERAVESAMDLFDAADAMSGDLAHLAEALVGDDSLFCRDCYVLTQSEWMDLDRLLILREIEILPQLRGYALGAWASARSVGLLARDAGTLIATLAAPLRRSEFLVGSQSDEHRDFTAQENAAWQAAQRKIAQHWQTTIGLSPLPRDPDVLVGTVETAGPALRGAVGLWA